MATEKILTIRQDTEKLRIKKIEKERIAAHAFGGSETGPDGRTDTEKFVFFRVAYFS